MPYVTAAPEMMAATATDLATVGSNLSAAHMAAAVPTVAVIPAAADEVSASIAQVFSRHGQGYQALAGQAVAFHEQFVQHLTAGAGSYTAAEAANASLLQPLNAAASTAATVPNVIINLVSPLLQALINFVSTATPPELILFAALATLSFPIWLPVAVVVGAAFLADLASALSGLPVLF